ncbi:MAG TPA: MFS transporter [Acidimicrobiales bacterium]|nr:MFS transporter [Acidimicrobiales bacterium]
MKKRLALVQLAHHREPTLLVSGQTISTLGDGIALVALTLLVLDTTHSATKLAWFAAARMIPLVAFLLIGGAIVDRFSRRLLLLISDVMRAVLTAALVVLLGLGLLRYWELLIFAVLFGAFDAVFMPAMTALTPEIVPEGLLGAMNAVRPLTSNLVGNMIGPALGGVIAAFSTTWAIGVDCATFVVSASTLAFMRATPHPVRAEGTTMVSEIREGLRYVRSTNWIWTTLLGVTMVNAFTFTPLSVLVPFFLRHSLHASKQMVGYSFAISGLSGALGALVASNLAMPRRRIRTMWTYWTLGTFAVLILGVATSVWQVFLVPLVVMPTMILGNVIWESMMQSEVPRELLGRVSSVDWFVSLGLAPVGLVASGAIASAVGVRTYFVVAALVSSVPGLIILASRRVNAVDRATPSLEG